MRTFTFPDGVTIDVDSGQIIGQDAPAEIPAKQITQRENVNIDKPMGRQAADALKQFSWGFNSALFALPDAAVAAVGRAAGVDEKEIPSFTRYFNAGQVAPEGQAERFALNIGKGAAAGLPLTGLLGHLSTTKALTAPLTADAGVLKRIAKDTLDYIRKDPVGAVKADLTFGGLYGALEQGVEEYMEPGQGKDIAKAVVPMAGILAVPTMLGMANKIMEISPTARAAKAIAGQQAQTDFSRDAIVKEMVGEKTPKIPGLNWTLGKIAGFNERQAGKRVAKILEPLSDPAKVNVQESIRITRELEDFVRNDPRLKDLGLSDRFLLDLAQMSLDGSVLAARNQVVRDLSGNPLTAEQLRQGNLEKVFLDTFQALAPKAPMEMSSALRAAYADHMNTVATATKQLKTATEEEALMFADRFKAANMDDLGSWFRDSMFAQMEGVFSGLRKKAESLGLREAVSPAGVALPTRSAGKPLEQYSPREFENFSRGLLNKYKLTANERIFVGQGTPAPVQYIERLVARFDAQKEKATTDALDNVIREWYRGQFKEGSTWGKAIRSNPELMQQLEPQMNELKLFVLGRRSAQSLRRAMGDDFAPPTEAEIKALMKQASDIATKEMRFEITRPEALDMLEQSLRYRNSALAEYNKRMDFGIRRNNAQRMLDTANDLHRDVEGFVLKTFGKDRQLASWLDEYEDTFRRGYEKAFPLLVTRKRGTDEFLLSSERVVQNALNSADNVRTMNTILGPDNVKYQQSLLDAMYDKAYRAGVLDKDGILDPKKYERFLQSNRNIIEAMPKKVQDDLRDEALTAEKSLKRLSDLRTRAEDVEDVELIQTLKKAVRQDADPQKLVLQAVDDPAVMRKLVDSLGNQPGQIEALRRQVWLGVEKELFNPQNPLFMEEFLKRNSKSLNILYPPQHLDDLRVLAEMQKRVFAGDRVQGKLSPFMSFDEKLRQTIGASVGTVESTFRAATVRIVSPVHAGVGLLTRLLTRQQTNAYEAVLYRALTDAKYAHELVNATASSSTPKGIEQQVKLAAKAGVFLPRVLSTYALPAARVGTIEGVQALEDETRTIPVREPEPTMFWPEVSEFTSPSGAPRTPQMPPAPAPARALTQSAPARNIPAMPSQGEVSRFSDFARLFPDDFVSPLIQQQQQP